MLQNCNFLHQNSSIPISRKLAMNSKLTLIAASLAILSMTFALLSTTTTHFLIPPPIPGSVHKLHKAEVIKLNNAIGPESLAFDPNGEGPYTGVADGRILKWEGAQNGWVDFAVTTDQRKGCNQSFAPEKEHICGRPLGLRFEKKSRDLYIADAYLGLQVVGKNGGLATPLVTEIEGTALRFTNDLDIDELEDVVYFTESSTRFFRRQFLSSAFSGDETGRLLKYDKASKAVTVVLSGLAIANGVALSNDGSFVLVAESNACRIIRLWLKGPNAGKSHVFANVPGFPDNIRRNSKGEFWVALHSRDWIFTNWAISKRWLGNTLLRLPFKQLHYVLVGGQAQAIAIKLSKDGTIMEVLEDFDGKTLRFISEVEEKDGKLWIGSVLMPYLGVYNFS